MNLHVFGKLAAIGLTLAIGNTAHAQAEGEAQRTYSFNSGGACQSQGAWTQQALNQTKVIRDVIGQLESDPNCASVPKALQATLAQIQADLASQDVTQKESGRLTTIPREIEAMRVFMTDSKFDRSSMLNSIMRLANDYASLSASKQAEAGPLASSASDVLNFGQKLQVGTNRSLKIFNDVVGSLTNNVKCLSAPQQGQLAAAFTSVLSAYASSGQDVNGNQMAMSVSKVNEYLSKIHFAKAIRYLNKAEFKASLSCLLEVTSESYCTAVDGLALFRQMTDEINVVKSNTKLQLEYKNTRLLDYKNPLYGYYILTQHVPTVTQWLQRVQIGVDPKLQTDALFQTGILKDVMGFYADVKEVQGTFSEDANWITNLTDYEARKIKIQELIMKLTETLVGKSRFFTASSNAIKIPFMLLGIGVPREFFDNNSTMTVGKWIQNDDNWRSIPESANPPKMIAAISENLLSVIAAAESAAITYYNTYFIADKTGILLDFLRGTNYNVKDSLYAIDKYLEYIYQKIDRNSADKSYLPSIQETRARIGKILRKANKISELGIALKANGNKIPLALYQEIQTVHKEFLDETYEQFQVMLAKSGWLANRVVRYVQYDFSLTLRNNIDLSPYYEDLFYATGFAAFDKMVSVAGGNPAAAKSDLTSALRINSSNLMSMEKSFRDHLSGMIREEKLVFTQTEKVNACLSKLPKILNDTEKINQQAKCVKQYQITPGVNYSDAHRAAYQEGRTALPGETTNRIARVGYGTWTSFKGLFLSNPLPFLNYANMFFDFDSGATNVRFDHGGSMNALFNTNNEKISFDDLDQAAKNWAARMCIQSLAFNDYRPFYHQCNGLVLDSPFARPTNPEAAKIFDNSLSVSYVNKAFEDMQNVSENKTKRICALRDYYRRNQVVFITKQRKEIAEIENDQPLEKLELVEVEEPVKPSVESDPVTTPMLKNSNAKAVKLSTKDAVVPMKLTIEPSKNIRPEIRRNSVKN